MKACLVVIEKWYCQFAKNSVKTQASTTPCHAVHAAIKNPKLDQTKLN